MFCARWKVIILLNISLILLFTLVGVSSSDITFRKVRFSKFQAAKNALLPEAQKLVDFLAGEQPETKSEKIGAPDFTEGDVKKYNPLMLLLGTPSPQVYANAAKRWKDYSDWWGFNVPIIASTGRGRGYKALVLNTLKFLEKKGKMDNPIVKEFLKKYNEDIKKARQLTADELFDEYNKGGLTPKELSEKLIEAKVIKLILMLYEVPEDAIILEEKSNNTAANMELSYEIIENIEKSYPDKKLAIHVVADGFHRLRSLLEAKRVFNQGWYIDKGELKQREKKDWLINAQPTYNPAKDSPTFDNMDELELAAYLKHMIGNPFYKVTPNHKRGWGEIERIFYRKLGEKAGLSGFEDFLSKEWGINATGLVDNGRIMVLRNRLKTYLESLAKTQYTEFNETLLDARVVVFLRSNKDEILKKGYLGLQEVFNFTKAETDIQKEMVIEVLSNESLVKGILGTVPEFFQ